ncbi:MAG: tetratricopeptide repeat protein [Planctomycetes bacterium]|nr:tetratricopeptide repeat protein [Planctomycetota bacterium]
MKALRVLTVLTFLVFLMPGLCLLAQEVDVVSSSSPDGKSVQDDAGEITSETYNGVEIKVKGTSAVKTIKLDLIKNITYRDEQKDYLNGKQLQQDGKYPQAIESYKKALNDTRLRAIFKQHVLYNIAVCYHNAKQLDEAIQAYDEVLKAFEKTRYFKQVYFNKSECAAKKPDLEKALSILDDAKVKGQDLGDKFKLEVDLRKANLLEDNKKLDEAKAIYNQLKTRAQMQPAIRDRAMIGLGRVELAGGNISGAEEAFNEVIEKSTDAVAKAGAYNGKGDCLMANPKADYKIIKNALFAYLRSKLLYPAPAGEPTMEEEKAIYNAGLCCEKLAQALPQEKKKVYINNAKILYLEVKQKFPGSRFVPEANKRLSELGK